MGKEKGVDYRHEAIKIVTVADSQVTVVILRLGLLAARVVNVSYADIEYFLIFGKNLAPLGAGGGGGGGNSVSRARNFSSGGSGFNPLCGHTLSTSCVRISLMLPLKKVMVFAVCPRSRV